MRVVGCGPGSGAESGSGPFTRAALLTIFPSFSKRNEVAAARLVEAAWTSSSPSSSEVSKESRLRACCFRFRGLAVDIVSVGVTRGANLIFSWVLRVTQGNPCAAGGSN